MQGTHETGMEPDGQSQHSYKGVEDSSPVTRYIQVAKKVQVDKFVILEFFCFVAAVM